MAARSFNYDIDQILQRVRRSLPSRRVARKVMASPPTLTVGTSPATKAADFTASISGTTMTVTAVASGSIVPGLSLFGNNVVPGTRIVSAGTGTGGTGTYTVFPSQTVASTAITATKHWATTTRQDVGNGTTFTTRVAADAFALLGAGGFAVRGVGANSSFAIAPTNVTYNDGSRPDNCWHADFMHVGDSLDFQIYGETISGGGPKVLIKIDDEYVSLTPTQVGTTVQQFISMPLGSVASRRISIIGKFSFCGVHTGANDSVYPAPVRGPRCIVVSDSFGEGTGASSAGAGTAHPLGLIQVFSDFLVWDDVWSSSVSGTGFRNAPTTKLYYGQRVATDVYPYSPEVVIFLGSVNDTNTLNPDTGNYTVADVQAEAARLVTEAKAVLPNTLICIGAIWTQGGAGTASRVLFDLHAALKAATEASGGLFTDLTELPLPIGTVPHTAQLVSSVAQNAGVCLVNSAPVFGGTYKFSNGERFVVKALSGNSSPFTITMDGGPAATGHSSGETITQVGPMPLTGTGRVGATTGWGNSDLAVATDGIHPSTYGHEIDGGVLADQFSMTVMTA